MEFLKSLGFGPRQSNEVAAYTFIALVDLAANAPWSAASNPLRGITPIIEFIAKAYGVRYAPNTRETIRDEAVKYFVETGLLLRNSDNPRRPTNSGKTVYQVEPTALSLIRTFGTKAWPAQLKEYLANRAKIRHAVERERNLARIPVKLLSGETMTLSPVGQNTLIKQIIEEFCPRFAPGATVVSFEDAVCHQRPHRSSFRPYRLLCGGRSAGTDTLERHILRPHQGRTCFRTYSGGVGLGPYPRLISGNPSGCS